MKNPDPSPGSADGPIPSRPPPRRPASRTAAERLAPVRGRLVDGLYRPVQLLIGQVLAVRPQDGQAVEYDQPLFDAGLLGPETCTWRIYGDFPGMITGGLCALMLQTLHPLALAGVYDHSAFRTDLMGRLRRTTSFVAATTYAPVAEAERLIARVNRIHEHVTGTAADGRPYRATDPRLLTWVHCTETASFLEGYRQFGPLDLTPAVEDAYFAETARLAAPLGATGVPTTRAEMDAYFAAVLPELLFDSRSAEVLDVLARARLPLPAPLGDAARDLLIAAGASLLPDWARARLGVGRAAALRNRAARLTFGAMAPVLHAALKTNGVAARACRRVGENPRILDHWPALGESALGAAVGAN